MADGPGNSRRSRKRKRTSEEDSGPPIPELVETMKKKNKGKRKKTSKKSRKKKNKEKELKPKAIPRSVHLFRPGKGQGTCTISPLKISNIQDLILFASLRQTESHLSTPKWCPYIHKAGSIQRVIIVLVSGVGAIEYAKNQDCFSQSSDIFEDCVETKASGPDFCVKLPHESLLSVNLSQNELKRRREEQLCNGNVRLGREDYILSIDEMWENDYPVPGHVSYDANKSKDNGFLSTKANNRSSNSSESPMYAIDCEMCQTTEGMELTRISLVDESLNVVYDTLVQPSSPIIDYKTEFSGITSKMLENVTTTLADVQKRLIDLLPPDAILLGHSLENDLRALKLHHGRVIDTSVMYSTPRGAFFKPSLRSLAKQHLKKKIQNGADGHCSIEDANACMELVQLKIQNGPNFGTTPVDKEGLFERTARSGKIASMLDYPGVLRKFCRGTTHAISCTSDEEMLSHAVKLMQTSDILWAHLHEPEMFLKEDQSNIEGKEERTWKDVLQSVDSRIKQIHEAAPSDSLLLIVLGCGDLSPVKRLQRQMKSHKAELKEAVKTAKKGVCFMKIKS